MFRFRNLLLALATATVGCSSSPPNGASNGKADSGGPVPGYYAETATVLAAPAAGAGIQIVTPDYSANDANAKNLIVQPGQEIFLCYYVTLPNKTAIDVGGFQSWMSPGSSHHFIAYQEGGTGLFAGTPQTSGTITSCNFGGGTWMYATS